MKYLLLLIFTFSLQAKTVFYKIEDGEIKYTTYDKKLCPGCVKSKTEDSFKLDYYDISDEMKDDKTKPLYEAKSDVATCEKVIDNPATAEVDESKTKKQDCIEKEAKHTCSGGDDYFVVRAKNNSEVYCTKVVGYEQKHTGFKKAILNQSAKDAYQAKKAQDKEDAKTKRNEVKAIRQLIKTRDLTSQELKKVLLYLLREL